MPFACCCSSWILFFSFSFVQENPTNFCFVFSIPPAPNARARAQYKPSRRTICPPLFLHDIYMSVQYRYIYNRSKKEPREKRLLRERKKEKKRKKQETYISRERARESLRFSHCARRRIVWLRLSPSLRFIIIFYSPCLCISTLCGGGSGSSVSVRRRSGIDDESPLQDGGLYSSRAQQLRLTPDTFPFFFFP